MKRSGAGGKDGIGGGRPAQASVARSARAGSAKTQQEPPSLPVKLGDLRAAAWNPREIGSDQANALKCSLTEFGDLSGICYNRKTGNLVTGHQRVDALKKLYGDGLEVRDGVIETPTGERFTVRVVDWPIERERAANLAANSPELQGRFTPDVLSLLEMVQTDLPDLSVDSTNAGIIGIAGRQRRAGNYRGARTPTL